MSIGKFTGIGVGPGDPELLTLKAVRALHEADVVIAPRTEKRDDSIALSIARPHMRSETEVLELIFPMVYHAESLRMPGGKTAISFSNGWTPDRTSCF